jgi:hypothetical protein
MRRHRGRDTTTDSERMIRRARNLAHTAVAVVAPLAGYIVFGAGDPGFGQTAGSQTSLGIDYSALPRDAGGASRYFDSQPPDVQRVLLSHCEPYYRTSIKTQPGLDAYDVWSLWFCQALQVGLAPPVQVPPVPDTVIIDGPDLFTLPTDSAKAKLWFEAAFGGACLSNQIASVRSRD